MTTHDENEVDPVVAEVRRARENLSADFHNDLHAIFEEMRRRQALAPDKYAVPAIQPSTDKSRKKVG